MTASRDPERLIHAFLQEGEEMLQDPIYDEVRAVIDHKRQRTFIGPWRTLIMNRFLTFGLGAAAVVVIGLLLGAQLLGSPTNPGGPSEPTATPEPSATTRPTATPRPAGLPEGPHLLAGEGDPGDIPTLPLTVTIPGPGWEGDVGGGILFWHGGAADEAGMIVFQADEYYVFGDPCNWESTMPDTPVTTVDDMVAALAAQPGRDASAPIDITIGGYTGKAITMHIPDNADFSECDQNRSGSWDCGDQGDPIACGFDEPGETSIKYILDVDGALVAWHTDYRAETPAEIVAEMEDLVLSARWGE